MLVKNRYVELGGELREFRKFDGEVEPGYRFEYRKKITEVDVELFGLVSGDFNPVHFDEDFARSTKFGGRVVHGMLTTSLVSAAVARLPGTVVLLETHFRYRAPVRIGDEVRVQCVVGEVDERKRCRVDVRCLVNDRVVADGWVKVLLW